MTGRLSPAAMRVALERCGLALAGTRAAGSLGRAEDARIRPARLVEPGPLMAIAVGPPTPCPHPIAFLDGVQHHHVAGYAGSAPLVTGEVAAAVRLREGPEGLRTVLSARVAVAAARREVLARAAPALAGYELLEIEGEEPMHPSRDVDQARGVIDRRRAALEVAIGTQFREGSTGWLLVDGSLARVPQWAKDDRMLGVSKSHATLPFSDAALDTYLRLPVGHRSTIFAPDTSAPVYSWGLRLRDWRGKDLFYGLIRVEAAPTEATLACADELSRWILAERAPLSAPDARWDRLLYGVRSVEQYLEATATP